MERVGTFNYEFVYLSLHSTQGEGLPCLHHVKGEGTARRHFNLPQILSVTFVFAPLSAAYYGLTALKNGRPDIAWAYLKGTLAGMFFL